MAKYQVLSPIKINDETVTEGYVEIPDKEVAELTRLGAIGGLEPSAAAVSAQRLDAITAAIQAMDKENPDLWLRDGKPDASVISEATGLVVTAGERNQAWAAIAAAQG